MKEITLEQALKFARDTAIREWNPGGDAAVENGCTCAVMDNGHGRGNGYGPGLFWIDEACPLHAGEEYK